MPYITLPASNQNLRLYYELFGSGDNKILFIMGLLTEGAAWCRQTEFFAQKPGYECVSYDNRGCGRSSSPVCLHYSTSQMARDALALIDHLKWKQCHVVGVSMGGMIAMEFAVLAPERIRSLTLLATHAGGILGQAPVVGVFHILRSIVLSNENSVIENVLLMLYAKNTLADPEKRKSFYDYHIDRFRKRIRPSLIGLVGHLTAVLRHYVSYAELLKIRYSPFDSLVIVGTEDRLVREKNSYLLQNVLGCRLIKLDNSGHGLQAERAEEVNQELFHMFESIRKNEASIREIPKDYATEIKALEQCCHHRTHCFIHDLTGFFKGVALGLILYMSLSLVGLTNIKIGAFHLTFQSVILLSCINGLRRSIRCVYKTLRARRFVRQHQLQLDRASDQGGIGITIRDRVKNGIPNKCGFGFPIHSLIITANLISLIYWLTSNEQKI